MRLSYLVTKKKPCIIFCLINVLDSWSTLRGFKSKTEVDQNHDLLMKQRSVIQYAILVSWKGYTLIDLKFSDMINPLTTSSTTVKQ